MSLFALNYCRVVVGHANSHSELAYNIDQYLPALVGGGVVGVGGAVVVQHRGRSSASGTDGTVRFSLCVRCERSGAAATTVVVLLGASHQSTHMHTHSQHGHHRRHTATDSFGLCGNGGGRDSRSQKRGERVRVLGVCACVFLYFTVDMPMVVVVVRLCCICRSNLRHTSNCALVCVCECACVCVGVCVFDIVWLLLLLLGTWGVWGLLHTVAHSCNQNRSLSFSLLATLIYYKHTHVC